MSKVLSAGIVPFLRKEEIRFLLLRSGSHWDFPKGLVNSDENPLDAAIRELNEETGIQGINFLFGQCYIETPPYGKLKKIARYYLGEVPLPVPEIVFGINPELGRPEHEEFCWFSYEECQDLLVPRLLDVLKWARLKITNEKA